MARQYASASSSCAVNSCSEARQICASSSSRRTSCGAGSGHSSGCCKSRPRMSDDDNSFLRNTVRSSWPTPSSSSRDGSSRAWSPRQASFSPTGNRRKAGSDRRTVSASTRHFTERWNPRSREGLGFFAMDTGRGPRAASFRTC